MHKIKRNKGITLIVLVVIIVILVILAAISITALLGENGIIEHAKWSSFSTRFRAEEESQLIYESGKIIEKTAMKKDMSIEEQKGASEKLSEEEKKEIEENNRSLAIKMQELSGKTVEEMEIYWLDNEKIGNNDKNKYIIDAETNQIYQYKGEKIYGLIWHTLDRGIGEDDEYIENSDKEEWEGWIKLSLNYPEGSSNWEWRLGAEGETRNDPNLRWQEYTEPIWVRIQDVENIWMRYQMNGEEIIIAPSGRVVVDIEPDSYYPTLKEKVKVKINYDKGAEIKEYKIGNGEWKEYEGEFYVTENTIVEARAKKVERIVNEFGEVQSEVESWGRDSVYINNIGIKEENENLPAPTIRKKAGGEGEIAKVEISYPSESAGGRLIYKIDYGEEQEYKGDIGIEKNGTYVIGYYYNSEGKRSKSSSILIREGGAETGSEYTPNKPGEGGEGGSNPSKPSYVIPGPNISASGGNVSISVPNGYTAKTIYYKIEGGKYQEYTGAFSVTRSCTIYAYYVTEKGERSTTSYKYAYVAEPNMPYVEINLEPSTYEVKYNAGKVIATISTRSSDKTEYSFNGVEWEAYTGGIEITENCRIYARGTNSNGETIVYANVTNLGEAPKIPEALAVSISTKNETDSNGEITKVKVSIGYDGRAEKKYYKIGTNGELKEYTEAFEVESNCTIYAYAISENGYGEAYKNIGGLNKGIGNPIITARPGKGAQSSKVTISIEYDENATEKKYRIDNEGWKDYTAPFTVEENCVIYAYNTNSRGERGESKYIVENILQEQVVTIIDKGDYYIIRLNYPPTAINKEYKWQETGTWKAYHETGLLLVKAQMKDKVEGADVVKVEDEGGKEVEFNKTDIYFITKPVNELVEQIFMRWDNMIPTKPEIILSTEEPCLELDVTINFDQALIAKQYRVVYPNGVITSWKDYQEGEQIHVTQKGTVIYAKGQAETGMWTQTAMRQVNNIDEEPPVITVTGDLETETTKLVLNIGVTDDVGLEEIKWAEGNRVESYFNDNGTSIYNRQEAGQTIQKVINKQIEVQANGYYTIYARDIVGNSGIYTLQIGNIDLVPPRIAINVEPQQLTTEVKINIDYEDSVIKQYKIGANNNTWSDYTGEITLSSYTVIANKWMNEDGTVTIYAKGKDTAGNETIEEKIISNLDTKLPKVPVINSNYGYPVITEYGIAKDGKTTIAYDTENIINYYKIDNEEWIEYTGEFEIGKACTIYAKSVKNDTGLEVTTSKTIKNPSDALGAAAYDGNDSTGVSIEKSTKKIKVSSEMQERQIYINIGSSYNTTTMIAILKDGSAKTILSLKDKSYKQNITIPKDTIELRIASSGAYVKPSIYEIQVGNEPVISMEKMYPNITEYGIEKGYNNITIAYNNTSVEKLYKIGEGEWNNYDSTVRLEIGETIYVKGIYKNGDKINLFKEEYV